MIEVTGVNKMFGEIKALDNIVATIQEGSIFGLIGTNGAGKSTLLRVISGVLKPDTGMALIDGENVYENPQAKAKIFFLPDNAYFFQNATAKTMAEYYQVIYPQFDMERFRDWTGIYKEAVHVFQRHETAGGTSSWRLCRNKISDM